MGKNCFFFRKRLCNGAHKNRYRLSRHPPLNTITIIIQHSSNREKITKKKERRRRKAGKEKEKEKNVAIRWQSLCTNDASSWRERERKSEREKERHNKTSDENSKIHAKCININIRTSGERLVMSPSYETSGCLKIHDSCVTGGDWRRRRRRSNRLFNYIVLVGGSDVLCEDCSIRFAFFYQILFVKIQNVNWKEKKSGGRCGYAYTNDDTMQDGSMKKNTSK